MFQVLPRITLGLLPVLLCLMLRNRAYRTWPWFFAYVAYGVSADLARVVTHSYPRPFYFTWWLTDAGYALLGTLAMYEILRKVLRGMASSWWTHLIFPAVVAAGVGLSMAHTRYTPPQVSGLLYYVVVGEIAVRFSQVLLFIGLAGVFWLSSFRWSLHVLGISAGYGLYSAVALLITIKLSDIGRKYTFSWGAISLVAYCLAVLIWICAFSVPQEHEPSPIKQAAVTPDQLRQDLEELGKKSRRLIDIRMSLWRWRKFSNSTRSRIDPA
jgi:hypothetical protein